MSNRILRKSVAVLLVLVFSFSFLLNCNVEAVELLVDYSDNSVAYDFQKFAIKWHSRGFY